jgi:hypothetical protein
MLILSFLSGIATADELSQHITPSGEPGPYKKERWKLDWPGCKSENGISEGRVELIKREGIPALHVRYPAGSHGQEAGGAGWRYPFGKHEEAELRYTVRFDRDFDFVKGGKLPGLNGGPESVTGGRPATGANGFSARLMWRKEGRGEGYIYHVNQPEKYGESFAFPKDFRFPKETLIHVRLAIMMNTVGKQDGHLRIWIALGDKAEQLLVERTNMLWRHVPDYGVDSILFNTFHGGSDATWAPQRDVFAEFSEFRFTVR